MPAPPLRRGRRRRRGELGVRLLGLEALEDLLHELERREGRGRVVPALNVPPERFQERSLGLVQTSTARMQQELARGNVGAAETARAGRIATGPGKRIDRLGAYGGRVAH